LRSGFAHRPSLPIALLAFVLLIAFASGYGYHRDELYFLAAGDHLAWGYPDQGPLTPLLAAVADALAPGSLTALRLAPALMLAATVLLAGATARELGATRRAEAIAAASTAAATVLLFTGHLLSTTTFDVLAWATITWLAVRAVRRDRPRLWLVAGAVLGVALLNKPLPAFLAAALAAAALIAGPRRLLREPWVWAGAALALLIWAPWLVWQADRGWPQLEVSSSIAAGGSTSSQPRWAFLPFQLLLAGPPLAPIWIAGLVRLFRDRELRFLGWTWLLLAAAFLVTGGKPYYLAGLLPLLFAAGAMVVERWFAPVIAAIAATAVVSAIIALPLLPVRAVDPVLAVNPDVGETIGWPSVARQVERAHAAAGPGAIVLAANYGLAGAIDRFTPLRAYSGHNAYADWGVPPGRAGPVVAVGFGRPPAGLERCRLSARIRSPHGIDNDENGAPIWTCNAPRLPWREIWPELRVLG
jgi:4-amino-4-deoxy-L-arabinose transferase-like glycosyltransferase